MSDSVNIRYIATLDSCVWQWKCYKVLSYTFMSNSYTGPSIFGKTYKKIFTFDEGYKKIIQTRPKLYIKYILYIKGQTSLNPGRSEIYRSGGKYPVISPPRASQWSLI